MSNNVLEQSNKVEIYTDKISELLNFFDNFKEEIGNYIESLNNSQRDSLEDNTERDYYIDFQMKLRLIESKLIKKPNTEINSDNDTDKITYGAEIFTISSFIQSVIDEFLNFDPSTIMDGDNVVDNLPSLKNLLNFSAGKDPSYIIAALLDRFGSKNETEFKSLIFLLDNLINEYGEKPYATFENMVFIIMRMLNYVSNQYKSGFILYFSSIEEESDKIVRIDIYLQIITYCISIQNQLSRFTNR